MADCRRMRARCPDGRTLDVLDCGRAGDPLLLYHSGTPSGAVEFPLVSEAAARRGLRMVTYSRPGYGESSPLPGRVVADVVADVRAILDLLGEDRLVTLGSSGGGPHALACGAGLGDVCAAVALMGSVAPYGMDGLDWFDGMGTENVEEFEAAVAGHDAITDYLADWASGRSDITAGDVAAAFGELASEVDRAALTGELAEHFAASMRAATSNGIAGWRDDDLAFTMPWNVDLERMPVPVFVWYGARDLMVPPAHGQWLCRHVAGATEHFLPDEGHLSLFSRIDPILDELAEAVR